MPAKAGIQYAVTSRLITTGGEYWIPAFAGMTAVDAAASQPRNVSSVSRRLLHFFKQHRAHLIVLAALIASER
jgi:hypothetical protein